MLKVPHGDDRSLAATEDGQAVESRVGRVARLRDTAENIVPDKDRIEHDLRVMDSGTIGRVLVGSGDDVAFARELLGKLKCAVDSDTGIGSTLAAMQHRPDQVQMLSNVVADCLADSQRGEKLTVASLLMMLVTFVSSAIGGISSGSMDRIEGVYSTE